MASVAAELTATFFKHLRTRYDFMVPNIYVRQGYEMDILAVRKSGFIDEVEIKCSRQDFLADFKKTATIQEGIDRSRGWDRPIWKTCKKHEAIQNGWLSCNYFSFLMPSDLAEQCGPEIPEYAGIYTAQVGEEWSLREIRKPKRLHTRKITSKLENRVLKKMALRYMDGVMGWGDG